MGKVLRFGDLVRVSGRPEPVILWTDPKNDRPFSKAVRENRVLTIIKDPKSTRKEFGQIGFHQGEHAFYFLFPKPLPKDIKRVIGINYQLTEEKPPQDPVPLKSSAKRTRTITEKLASPPSRTFDVLIRRTASIEQVIEVKSKDENSVREMALEKVKSKRFELTKAVMHSQVLDVKQRG
jgi:hypothetical protein